MTGVGRPVARLHVAAGLFLLPALSSCSSCESVSISTGSSTLVTDRRVIDFGNVYIGASARATIVLSAPGTAAIRYTTALEGDAWGYQAGPAVGRIDANGAQRIDVTFRPAVPGAANARLRFKGDGTRGSSATVDLIGTGLRPPDCEDGNGCTVDTFNFQTGMCEHKAERRPCTDFNACTQNAFCVDGICRGESRSCDDNNVCTEDLCDPLRGCVHIPMSSCNSHNPCIADSCHPTLGCQHRVAEDGTPCDLHQQCVFANICVRGTCVGVNIPDGAQCDDGNPCSKNDRCVEGVCKDPTYTPPAVGEIKFATDVGALAEGASENPIIDRDSTVFVGIERGVAAVDRCGEVLWTNDGLGLSRFRAAVSLPGLLSVPVGSRVVDLDTQSGAALHEVELAGLFSGQPAPRTATITVRVLDLALRASGAIVASVVREVNNGTEVTRQGLIAEVDRMHSVATPFLRLGAQHASRLAIDADEAVIAVLRSGRPDTGAEPERVARFGLNGTLETSWSTNAVSARHSEIAIDGPGNVLWTAGLVAIARAGTLASLLPRGADADPIDSGSPLLTRDDVVLVRAVPGPMREASSLFAPAAAAEILALDSRLGVVRWNAPLPLGAERMSPAVDAAGNVYLTTPQGVLHAWSPLGAPLFVTSLPFGAESAERVALGISSDRVVVAVARRRVFGVQSTGPLGNSSWPRHRRDNLATGHR